MNKMMDDIPSSVASQEALSRACIVIVDGEVVKDRHGYLRARTYAKGEIIVIDKR